MFILALVTAFAVVLLALGIFIGNMLFNLALRPASVKSTFVAIPPSRVERDEPDENAAEAFRERHRWIHDTEFQDSFITSFDGLRLRALRLEQPGGKWAIVCHGYMNIAEHMKGAAYAFWRRGYSVLMPDARAHGKSEGVYIGMGWHERHDIARWIASITEKDPDAEITLYGTSMGASTVMTASGETLPSNVKAVIADCGYTCAWDEFTYLLRSLFRLGPFPLLHIASLIARLRAGYSFHDASALKQVAKSKIPTLFIHGTADTMVPVRMVHELFEAAGCPKDIMIAENAAHCMSAAVLGDEYWSRVFSFIEKYN